MDEETNGIPQNRPALRDLDAIDRRILGVLVDDAKVSYAELGDRVGLSPPAAHERVKRQTFQLRPAVHSFRRSP